MVTLSLWSCMKNTVAVKRPSYRNILGMNGINMIFTSDVNLDQFNNILIEKYRANI